MTFFQQLATLIGCGHAAPAGDPDRRPAVREPQAPRGPGGDRRPGSPPAARSTRAAANYPQVFEHAWIEMIRTGEITGKMGLVLLELEQAGPRVARDPPQGPGRPDVPDDPAVVAVLAVTAMLWFVVPTFTKMFERDGGRAAGDHADSWSTSRSSSSPTGLYPGRRGRRRRSSPSGRYLRTEEGRRRGAACCSWCRRSAT